MLHRRERVALAASFRWAARLNLHEGVANHFSLAVNDGTHFLLNPNQRHFSRIRASDLLLLDVDDMAVMERDDAPDPTAWGLHGSVHRHCPRARCIMHVHPIYSTVLASLADSNLPPIDQNTAIFFNRYVIDDNYGGLAFSEEGQRCAELLSRNECKVMIMGNHGIMVIGNDVADTFNRLYYFERAAETYVKALWTQKPLRILADELAERTAHGLESYPGQGDRHFNELLAILDAEESDYAD
ncbi:MAG: class II aldolase/adducin family protein [Pseudomonadota bacterium]|nr:class II aldolase/adducin family protein [Pseudomonadota bacterium]